MKCEILCSLQCFQTCEKFLGFAQTLLSSTRTSGQVKRFWSVLAWFWLQEVFKLTFITTRITTATTPEKMYELWLRGRRCGWAHCYCYIAIWSLNSDIVDVKKQTKNNNCINTKYHNNKSNKKEQVRRRIDVGNSNNSNLIIVTTAMTPTI